MDKTMEASLCQMLGACAGVSSFIGMSAFRLYAAGMSSDWNNTTCALLLPVPCMVAAFFYKFAPWISGAPAGAYSSARKEDAPGGEDAPEEAACKGSVACILSYARLFLFTLLLSTFSSVSLAGSYKMHLIAACRAPGAASPADTLSAEFLKLDVDGDGDVSLEEMGFGTPPNRGRQLFLPFLILLGELLCASGTAATVVDAVATVAVTIVVTATMSQAIDMYQARHPEIPADAKIVPMLYDDYKKSAACQASSGYSTCVVASERYTCCELLSYGSNCQGCCDFHVQEDLVLYDANAFYCDCKWTSDYACPGKPPGPSGNAKSDNSPCLAFCCEPPLFPPLHAGGAKAPNQGHAAGLVLELEPLPAGQQHALPVYTETVVILATVPVYFMAKALHSRASRIQSPRPVSLV